ncbi:MAG: hypothetical protein NTV34_11360, partial [Proteobacteria bacterium]|nr:hypothetical protein [Pseudomonadota bacterium]
IKQEVIGARKNDIGFDYSDANEERLREKMEKRVDELSARKSDFSPCARLRRALGTFHPSN